MTEIFSYVSIALVFLWFINRYVFSWLGLFLNIVGLIHYKAIDNIEDSVQGTRLSYLVNLQSLASVITKNSDYQILNHGHSLLITRKWGKVQYRLFFTNSDDFSSANSPYRPNYKGYFKVSNQRDHSIYHGEKPFVPVFILRRRIFKMINDLPLTRLQKLEIKRSIRIRWCSSISLGWI